MRRPGVREPAYRRSGVKSGSRCIGAVTRVREPAYRRSGPESGNQHIGAVARSQETGISVRWPVVRDPAYWCGDPCQGFGIPVP